MKTQEQNSHVAVAVRIYKILIDRIARGHYPPGSRLDSVRTLRTEFNVSNTVMMQTLDMLEKDQLIVRMPCKGIYVSSVNRVETKPLKVMMVFPEPAISPDYLRLSNWHANTEIYRAIYEVGAQTNTSIHLEYFPETEEPLLLKSQLQRLEGYDAAIFYGDQCKPLRRLAGERFGGDQIIAVIQWGRLAEAFPGELKIGYSDVELIRRFVDYLSVHAYKNSCFIYHALPGEVHVFFDWRFQMFQKLMIEAGVQQTPPAKLMLNQKNYEHKEATQRISEFLEKGKYDFIFFNGDDFSVCYEAVAMTSMIPGVDIDIGYAGPYQLAPMALHVQPPFYEIGEAIGWKLVGCLRNHDEIPKETMMIDSYMMVGGSVVKEPVKV